MSNGYTSLNGYGAFPDPLPTNPLTTHTPGAAYNGSNPAMNYGQSPLANQFRTEDMVKQMQAWNQQQQQLRFQQDHASALAGLAQKDTMVNGYTDFAKTMSDSGMQNLSDVKNVVPENNTFLQGLTGMAGDAMYGLKDKVATGWANARDEGGWLTGDAAFGYTDEKGNKHQGWFNPAVNAGLGISQAILGWKQYDLAKDQFDQNQANWDKNYAMQLKAYNAEADRRKNLAA